MGGQDADGNTDVVKSEVSIPYFGTGTQANVALYYYTALVHLTNGIPTEITWEYGDCTGCADNLCLPDLHGTKRACGYTLTECPSDSSACQPRTYLAFKGTDKKGIVLTSSGS